MKSIFVKGTDFRGTGYCKGFVEDLYGVTTSNYTQQPYFFNGSTSRCGKSFNLAKAMEHLSEGDRVYMDGNIYTVVSLGVFVEEFGDYMFRLAKQTSKEFQCNSNYRVTSIEEKYGIPLFMHLVTSKNIVAIYKGDEYTEDMLKRSNSEYKKSQGIEMAFHRLALIKTGTYKANYVVLKYNNVKKLFSVVDLSTMQAGNRSAKFIQLNNEQILNGVISNNTFDTLAGVVSLSDAEMSFQEEHYSTVERPLKRYNAKMLLASDSTADFNISPDGIIQKVNYDTTESQVYLDIPDADVIHSIGKKALVLASYGSKEYEIFIPESIQQMKDDSFCINSVMEARRAGRHAGVISDMKIKVVYDGYSRDVQKALLNFYKDNVGYMRLNSTNQFIIQFNHIVALQDIQFINSYRKDGSLQFGLQFGENAIDSYKFEFYDVCEFASNIDSIKDAAFAYNPECNSSSLISSEFCSTYKGTHILHLNTKLDSIYQFYAMFMPICKSNPASGALFVKNLINACDKVTILNDAVDNILSNRGIKQMLEDYFNTGTMFNGKDGYDNLTLAGWQERVDSVTTSFKYYSFDLVSKLDMSEEVNALAALGVKIAFVASPYSYSTVEDRTNFLVARTGGSTVFEVMYRLNQNVVVELGLCDSNKQYNVDKENSCTQKLFDNIVQESPTVAQICYFLGQRIPDILITSKDTDRTTKLNLQNKR